MTLFADYATPLDPAAVKAAGYAGVIRYIAPPGAVYDPKRLTLVERDRIFAAGLSILLVFESYATRATEGAPSAFFDAHTAVQQAHALGYPDDVPILFACDTNTTADQVCSYFVDVATIRPCCGAYGGINVVDPLLADGTVSYGWQTCAWSGDKVSQAAHLYQRLKPTLSMPGSYDEDVLLRPLPLWTSTQSQPRPKEDRMDVVRDSSSNRCYLRTADGKLIYIPDGPDLAAEQAKWGPLEDLTAAYLAGFDGYSK